MSYLSAAAIDARAGELLMDLLPPPLETVSEWTDEYRYTERGKYYVSMAEYQREPMDAISDPFVEEVVLMWSVQTGKTELILNTLGRFAHREPCHMMWVLPMIEMANNMSKGRLDPMFEKTPPLQSLLGRHGTRNADNSMRFKRIPGGFIILAGANSPASLSSYPIRILVGDEIDRWGKLVRGEGDILMLARKRTTSYSDRKIILVSSPTTRGASRIYPAYMETNQKRRFVPCPHCNGMQTLKFPNLKFEYDKEAIQALTADGDDEFDYKRKAIAAHIHAYFVCELCGAVIEHDWKHEMVQAGEWRAKYPKIRERQGFHLWQAYSPFVTWAETAAEFLHSVGYPDRMQVFTNTGLAELWEEKGGRIDDEPLMGRRERFPERLPLKAEIITCGVDVQGDRLEVEVIAWASDGENWSLEYSVLRGNTELISTFDQLFSVMDQHWVREDGVVISVDMMAVDTGYNPTDKKNTEGVDSHVVYRWVRQAARVHKIISVKGASQRVEGVVKESRVGKSRQKLWLVDGNQVKDVVLRRLEIEAGNPGSAHFPHDRDKNYFMMLTAEEKKKVGGIMQWAKIRERNEAVDTRVYAYAALLVLKPKWGKIRRRKAPDEAVSGQDPVQDVTHEEPVEEKRKKSLRLVRKLTFRRRR